MTKLAVLCHCVEEDPDKGLFHGQPVVPAHGIGVLGPTAGRIKTVSSLSCVCNVEKGLLKAPHASDKFFR